MFIVPHKPLEVARCFCSICKRLSHKDFESFAKYDKAILAQLCDKSVLKYRSSNHAVRGFCKTCFSALYMLYDNSPNVWLVADTFNFNWSQAQTYDIYR
jgi:hypothetical protein